MADPYAGQNLYAQLVLTGQGSSPGSSTASFTNIQFSVVAPRPSLTTGSAGPGQIHLRWPTNFDWCALESATNCPADNWESVTNAPTVQENQFVIPLTLQAGQRFFRLRVL